LALDLPERKLKLDARGHVVSVETPERLDAHRLIEEFMILANVAAAETLEGQRIPLIFRVHDEPSVEKMRSLAEIMLPLGIKLPKQGALSPGLFNGLLERVRGGPNELFVNEMVLRSQAQAVYSPANLGHFGLTLRRYAHFTSPIRRYADLVVHRGLIRAMGGSAGALPKSVDHAQLTQISEQISAAERRAMAAERETVDRLIAYFLADRVGASFPGRIAGVNRAGLFVRLDDTGADGFIPVATMERDHYIHDEGQMTLTGRRTGESFRLGDRVEVRLVEAVPLAGALRFELLSEGRYVEPASSFGKRRGRRLAGHAPPPRSGPRKGKRRK
jgi:ribonuclease R